MLCKECGFYAEEEAIVCPRCGATLRVSSDTPAGGAEAIRQGKRAREAVKNRPAKAQARAEAARKRRSGASRATIPMPAVRDTREDVEEEDVLYDGELPEDGEEEDGRGIERRNRPVYSERALQQAQASAYAAKHRPGAGGKMVNWFKIGLVLVIVVLLVTAGGYLFLKRTGTGQQMMARMGREASSEALWKVGEEMMDTGDIEGAIRNFEKAKAQDAENDVVDVDGLLLLGSAYEAAGQTDKAAALYEEIYTATPSRSEAYTNHIRILLASGKPGDKAKASELMKTAYQKTGNDYFYTQRLDYVPAPPEVDLTAGYYETKKYISITSYQGFDCYYTFDENAELPAGGTKFTERVFLDEGIHTLRAVAVNDELVSDELKGTYRIIMPSPQTPRSSLAPNTYKTRQRVWLKPGLDNENDDDIVIYYTIDGSSPDADSPIFDGDPFWLPGGRVTLKAVAVNKYNKVSNMLEILYKIDIRPEPLRGYNVQEDGQKDFTLYVTTMMDFQSKFGEGTLVGPTTLEDLDTECRRYDYPWGYAVMSKIKSGWVLAEVCVTSGGTISGPRGTKIGDSETFVVGKFRDMGQVQSASGNRGLYSSKDGTGKIWVQEDGTRIIRYRTQTEDSHFWQLDYHVSSTGFVTAIDMRYYP